MFVTKTGKTGLSELADRELVSWILEHAQSQKIRLGQEELYGRYAAKIYHKSISLIQDREAAKDLTHDIFIKVFLNLSRYKSEGKFYSWVFAITYNACFDYLRNQKKVRPIEITEVMAATMVDETELALQHSLFKEAQLSAMEWAFGVLKSSERIILSMYYQEKMSVKMIAASLKIGEGAVKMRLLRSREHLAKLIKNVSDGEAIQ